MQKSQLAKTSIKIPEIAIFGQNINSIRTSKVISINEFSQKLNYDRNRLSDLIEGYQNIHLSTAIRIARELDCSLAMLFSNSFIDDPERCSNLHFSEENYLEVFICNVNEVINASSVKKTNAFRAKEKAFRILSARRLVNDPTVKTLGDMAQDLNVPLSKLLLTRSEKENNNEIYSR